MAMKLTQMNVDAVSKAEPERHKMRYEFTESLNKKQAGGTTARLRR